MKQSVQLAHPKQFNTIITATHLARHSRFDEIAEGKCHDHHLQRLPKARWCYEWDETAPIHVLLQDSSCFAFRSSSLAVRG